MAYKLSKRDKKAVLALAVCLGIFLLLQFVYFPMMDRKEFLEKRIVSAQKDLAKMKALATQYDAMREGNQLEQSQLAGSEKDFSLFSVLEKIATESGIKDHIAYMKPSTIEEKDSPFKISLVELKLDAIATEQLVLFLYQVENHLTPINVRKMSISKTGKEENLISATLQVDTLIRPESAVGAIG